MTREAFERAISDRPYEKSVARFPDDPKRFAWPGNYRDIAVDLAWCMWQAAVASHPPAAGASSEAVTINPPDFGEMPMSVTNGMNRKQLWGYANLCGYRAGYLEAATAPAVAAELWMPESINGISIEELRANELVRQAAVAAEPSDAEEIEAVIACLGDDAASLREDNPEDERAANMERAAELLGALLRQGTAAPASVPKWIDDPHDIEQGRMLNPEWLKLHGMTANEAMAAESGWSAVTHASAPAVSEPSDAQIVGLNAGERFFSESPTKYPEAGHGTQYHAGAPGIIGFARAAIAFATPTDPKASDSELIEASNKGYAQGLADGKAIADPKASALEKESGHD